MPITYNKLFNYLKQNGLKQKDLHDITSDPTLAKMRKNEPINTSVLSAICSKLNCNLSDIAEYEYDEADCRKQDKMKR